MGRFLDLGFESDLLDRFEEFHEENPRIYDLFKRFAFEAIRSGRQHFGAKIVWERLRWYEAIETQSDDIFKLNNNHHAYYARLFMQDYPEHDGFFRLRKLAEERQEEERLHREELEC